MPPGMDLPDVSPLLFGPAVSRISRRGLRASPLPRPDGGRGEGHAEAGTLMVEGIGGLMVPLSDDFTVRDLAVELGLPLIIAARPGLGTINHSLLTLAAARSAGLDVRAIVLTPWPQQPSEMELSNRASIARLGEVQVHTLAQVRGMGRSALARGGGELPWREWLAPR